MIDPDAEKSPQEKIQEKLAAIAAKLGKSMNTKPVPAELKDQIGQIHRWFPDKNFGFFLVDLKEYFVHLNDLPKEVKEKGGSPQYQMFMFDVEGNTNQKAGRAANVRSITKMKGVCKEWLWKKGYGFVACAQGSYFLHRRDLPRGIEGIETGALLEFDVGKDKKTGKLHAKNIKITDERPRRRMEEIPRHRIEERPRRLIEERPRSRMDEFRTEGRFPPEHDTFRPSRSRYDGGISSIYEQNYRRSEQPPWQRQKAPSYRAESVYEHVRSPKELYEPQRSPYATDRPSQIAYDPARSTDYHTRDAVKQPMRSTSYRNPLRDEYYGNSNVEPVRKIRPPPPDYEKVYARKEIGLDKFHPYENVSMQSASRYAQSRYV